MNNKYVLGKNKTVFETAEFPQLAADEKIGILFQGGIESTLLALIAKELYGIDRVVFILIAFDEFLLYKKDEDKLNILKTTFQKGVEILGGKHTLEIGNEVFKKTQSMTAVVKKILLERYQGKLKFVLSGHTKLHEESMTFLNTCGWSQGKITDDKLKPLLEKNADKYPELYQHVIENNGKIFGVSKYIGFEHINEDFYTNVRPFRNLMPNEIIDLYDDTNFISYLYKTSSCDVDVGNCGICSGCVKRKRAFRNSSVTDLTKYSFN